MAQTPERLRSVVARIKYPGLRFEIVREDGKAWHGDDPNWRPTLRVACDNGVNNMTGATGYSWTGRKWPLSIHMTDGEVVQTAWLALLVALEHEAREQFTFMGVSVLDPHYDIHKLVALRRTSGSLKERQDTTEAS